MVSGQVVDGSTGALAEPAQVTELPDEGSAAVAALAGKRRVEVTGRRTETERVFANPDGTFTLEQHIETVRVRRKDGWVPVDTTLVRRPDGAVAPRATTVDLVFSGGGSAPLATAERDGKMIGLGWPAPLPAPVLTGDTATYPEVLPGVDLKVRAETEGFSEALVVKTAEAARNSALAKVKFTTITKGVRVQADREGNLHVVNERGDEIFRAPTPKMWDSTGAEVQTARLTDPAEGARRADMAITVDHDTGTGQARGITVIPDQKILTGPETRYPVLVDPRFGGGTFRWIHVNKKFPAEKGWNYDRVDGGAKAGFETRNHTTYRSFFRMNTAPMNGKHILSAAFRITEAYSWSCQARPVDLWMTWGFNENTSWNTQPAWVRKIASLNVAKGYSGSCPAGGVEFNALSAVAEAAGKRWANLTLGLRAADETDEFGWKKFTPNAVLEVVYNSVPAAPSSMSTNQGVPCVTGANRPRIGTTTPILRAVLTDADNSVRARFQWYSPAGFVGEYLTALAASGTKFEKMIPAGHFANGSVIGWRVRGEDEARDSGPYGPWCEFQVDLTAPDKLPEVSSVDYPEDELSGSVGQPGTFTFAPNGVPDVKGYKYALHGLPVTWVPAGPDGTATLQITPESVNTTLSVVSVDAANNESKIREYTFDSARGRTPVATWKLDETTGATAADTSGNGHVATLAGGASWVRGRSENSLRLDGSTGRASTAGPVVRADKSFAVAGWVKLTSAGRWGAMISQPGTRAGSFDLQYSQADNRWAFTMYSADADSAVVTRAVSTHVPQLNAWTHLAGVYDSGAKEIRIYVDGVFSGKAAFSGGWTGTAGTQLGRARWAGADVNYWPGELDEIQVYDRAIFAEELQAVADKAALAGVWHLEETTGTAAAESSGTGNTATLGAGASWTDGLQGNGIGFNGSSTGFAGTTRPAVRTDRSFTVAAWVRLDAAGSYVTAVSQDGAQASGFFLQYESSLDRWAFGMTSKDAAGYTTAKATSEEPPVLGVWTHLVGVYDDTHNNVRLYVDGRAQGQTTHSSTWNATGPVQLGRLKHNGAYTGHLPGAVDEVRIYHGALTDQQIPDLFDQPGENS